MSKKVSIICISYPPEKGAAPTRIHNLAKMLRDHGYEVQVITAMPNYPLGRIFPEYRGKVVNKEKSEGISIRRLWLYPSNSRNPVKRIISMFSYTFSLYVFALPRLIFNRPNYVVISSPPLLSGYAGTIISRLIGSKTILNVSDIWPSTALELGAIKKGSFYNLLEWIEKRMYKLAKAYVGQSVEILDHINKVTPHNKKQFLYRNLLEVSPFINEERPQGKKKIVYAGLIGIAQGIYDMCREINFNELGVEFHVYGDGFEKNKLIEFIAKNPDHGIYYHDSIPSSDIPAMLRNYHATLVPLKTSIYGAVPSKVFMAMANGVPIFFSGTGEGARIVQEGNMGWVSPPADYDTLRDNIRKMVAMSPAEYLDIRQNCIAHVQSPFNKQRQDEAFHEFLKSL